MKHKLSTTIIILILLVFFSCYKQEKKFDNQIKEFYREVNESGEFIAHANEIELDTNSQISKRKCKKHYLTIYQMYENLLVIFQDSNFRVIRIDTIDNSNIEKVQSDEFQQNLCEQYSRM